MPKKQKAKIKQKNKCPEKLIRTEAAKEIAEIDRSLQDQKYQLRCRAAIELPPVAKASAIPVSTLTIG